MDLQCGAHSVKMLPQMLLREVLIIFVYQSYNGTNTHLDEIWGYSWSLIMFLTWYQSYGRTTSIRVKFGIHNVLGGFPLLSSVIVEFHSIALDVFALFFLKYNERSSLYLEAKKIECPYGVWDVPKLYYNKIWPSKKLNLTWIRWMVNIFNNASDCVNDIIFIIDKFYGGPINYY